MRRESYTQEMVDTIKQELAVGTSYYGIGKKYAKLWNKSADSIQMKSRYDNIEKKKKEDLTDEYIKDLIYASVYQSSGETIDKSTISNEDIEAYREARIVKDLHKDLVKHEGNISKEELHKVKKKIYEKKLRNTQKQITNTNKTSLIQETVIINDSFREIISNKDEIIYHLEMLKNLLIQF